MMDTAYLIRNLQTQRDELLKMLDQMLIDEAANAGMMESETVFAARELVARIKRGLK